MHDTLDEEDVLMISVEYKTYIYVNLVLVKTIFLKVSLPTSGRQRLSRLCYMSRTTTHAEYDQANKLVIVLEFTDANDGPFDPRGSHYH